MLAFISKGEMARLRLQAGCCMLKLAQEPVYADAIKLEQFQTMALLASVSNLHFRYNAVMWCSYNCCRCFFCWIRNWSHITTPLVLLVWVTCFKKPKVCFFLNRIVMKFGRSVRQENMWRFSNRLLMWHRTFKMVAMTFASCLLALAHWACHVIGLLYALQYLIHSAFTLCDWQHRGNL